MKYDFEMFKGFCVYLIENTIDKTQYVGMTRDIRKRMSGHLSQARTNKNNSYLHNAIRKHGDDNFRVSILHFCDSHESAADLERIEINLRNTKEQGYNATSGGDGVRDLKPEIMERLRIAMSKVKSGVPLSEHHKRALSASLKGRVFSEQHKQRISLSRTGVPASEKAKAAMSRSRSGMTLSDSHKKSMSESRKGKKLSEETKEKLRAIAIETRARPVLCVETGMEFKTILDATSWLRLNVNPKAGTASIGAACRGENPRAHGFHWKYIEVKK